MEGAVRMLMEAYLARRAAAEQARGECLAQIERDAMIGFAPLDRT